MLHDLSFMTIGIDARFLGTATGFDRYLSLLLEKLEETDRAHQYIIFVSENGDACYSPSNANFEKKIIDYPWYSLKEQLIGREFKKAKVDLMHIPHWNVPWWMPVPYVVTIHDLILYRERDPAGSHLPKPLFYLKYWAFRAIFRQAVRRACYIFTPSQFTTDDLLRCFPSVAEKTIVSGEGVRDFNKIEPDQSILTKHQINQPYFLYVGSAYPHKNLKRLLQAFHVFHKENPASTLVLAGNRDRFYDELISWARTSGFDSGLLMIGRVGDAELSALYRSAEALLYPSLIEGFGLPPLEALSVGTPVIVSKRGSLPEILGNEALYCDPENIASMVQAMREVKNQKIIRQSRPWSMADNFGSLTRDYYDKALKNC